jgi:hypothetical protein
MRVGTGMLFAALMWAGCSSGSSTTGDVFGVASPATGSVSMKAHGDAPLVSGVIFRNDGTSDIDISDFSFVIAGRDPESLGWGFTVAAGDTMNLNLCVEPAINYSLEHLDSIAFVIAGTTEKLTILELKQTGTEGGPAHN